MAKPLPTGFELCEAVPSDSDEIWQVLEAAFADDETWIPVFSGCKKDDIHPWITTFFVGRWALPDISFYKIVEKKTGRIAGWTALQFPWVDRPLNDGELAMVNSHDLPPALEGMNMEALVNVVECLSFAADYGYEPKTDYHRKGTMIHPDFQKRGFGTALTYHCNAIAEETGGKTWVPARPSSVKMFRQCGFKDVGTHNSHLERFGRNPEKNTTYLLVR